MPVAPLRQLSLWERSEEVAEWTVRESARARRLSVRVWRDGAVEVVVPRRTRPEEVSAFVGRHRQWIERQRVRSTPRDPEPFPPRRIEFAATGESWICRSVPGRGGVRVVAIGSELELPGDAPAARLRATLRRWLAERARATFEPRLTQLAAHMGVDVARLQIRRQRTRWGSCSTRGTLSLNSCLLFQRPEVVRYLMVHELAHVEHMNHSVRFWNSVARFEPEWRALDRELVQGWRRVPRWAFG
jgi:predicted metal-dependent hydrolase